MGQETSENGGYRSKCRQPLFPCHFITERVDSTVAVFIADFVDFADQVIADIHAPSKQLSRNLFVSHVTKLP